MKIYVGNTAWEWFDFLRARNAVEEANFWQPGGHRDFSALDEGEVFLFRLKRPINKIAGGGVFLSGSRLPLAIAWEAFREKNGVESLEALRTIIAQYRHQSSVFEDSPIGCVVLLDPVFLPESEWIPIPSDYSTNIVQGKSYDVTPGSEGMRLFRWANEVLFRAGGHLGAEVAPASSLYGSPTLFRPRMGQGAFRVRVTDIYSRRCAISRERTLPVLEAAHIRPVAQGGQHEASNGLLLRRDIHTLFDLGYVGVDPDYRFRVSPQLRETWSNGRIYYELGGREIEVPADSSNRPSRDTLAWHIEKVFRS